MLHSTIPDQPRLLFGPRRERVSFAENTLDSLHLAILDPEDTSYPSAAGFHRSRLLACDNVRRMDGSRCYHLDTEQVALPWVSGQSDARNFQKPASRLCSSPGPGCWLFCGPLNTVLSLLPNRCNLSCFSWAAQWHKKLNNLEISISPFNIFDSSKCLNGLSIGNGSSIDGPTS